MRNPGTKKGAVVGSGGQKSKGLQGKGPTPKAAERPNHPAAQARERRREGRAGPQPSGRQGRRERRRRPWPGATPSSSACAPGSPPPRCTWRWASTRTTGSPRRCNWRPRAASPCSRCSAANWTGSPAARCTRASASRCRPTSTPHPDDLLKIAQPIRPAAAPGRAGRRHRPAQPRRRRALGGGVRRARRRAAAAPSARHHRRRLANQRGHRGPDADRRATNLTRSSRTRPKRPDDRRPGRGRRRRRRRPRPGHRPAGASSSAPRAAASSRLVKETCDQTVSIPMAAGVESLNASVAAGVVLAEIARRRRLDIRR